MQWDPEKADRRGHVLLMSHSSEELLFLRLFDFCPPFQAHFTSSSFKGVDSFRVLCYLYLLSHDSEP